MVLNRLGPFHVAPQKYSFRHAEKFLWDATWHGPLFVDQIQLCGSIPNIAWCGQIQLFGSIPNIAWCGIKTFVAIHWLWNTCVAFCHWIALFSSEGPLTVPYKPKSALWFDSKYSLVAPTLAFCGPAWHPKFICGLSWHINCWVPLPQRETLCSEGR